jgi:hypothetical protein
MANDTDIFGTHAAAEAPGIRDGDIFKDLPQQDSAEEPSPKMAPRQPTPTELAIQRVKNEGWGSGFPKFAYDLGGRVTDLAVGLGIPAGGAAGAGFAANVLTQAIPTFLSSPTAVGTPPPSLLNWPKLNLPKWLMQTAVKPTTDDLLSGAGPKAIQTMLDEGITPTMGGMEKAAKISATLDDQVGNAISKSQAKVSVPSVASRLDDTLKSAEMQVNPKTDVAAVENAWTEFLTNPLIAGKKEIPVQLAHELKKGTYKALGGKSYGEVGSTSVEAQKGLARGLREETMSAVPEIAAPLARQASLMNVRDVAGARALLEANKNPGGLATLRLDHPLSAATFMADRWAWLKAMLALGLYKGTYPQTLNAAAQTGSVMANQPALLSPEK